ncbi:MAG: NifU family protein [Pyrinomonadaceae bacterium]
MINEKNLAEQMRQIEILTREVESLTDTNARTKAVELARLLMEYHGAALERVLEIVSRAGAAGETIFAGLERDELASGLLLLYGLHPLKIETRVENALEKVRPLLKSHGGDAELVGIGDGVVSLNLVGNCDGCPSSSATLKNAIEQAIYEAAPDVVEIKVVNAPAEQSAAVNLVQIGRNSGSTEKNSRSMASRSLLNIT